MFQCDNYLHYRPFPWVHYISILHQDDIILKTRDGSPPYHSHDVSRTLEPPGGSDVKQQPATEWSVSPQGFQSIWNH